MDGKSWVIDLSGDGRLIVDVEQNPDDECTTQGEAISLSQNNSIAR